MTATRGEAWSTGVAAKTEARAIDRIAQVLASTGAPGAFATRRTACADELQLDAAGVGPIPLPLPPAIARRLRGNAHPARCGLRGQTLLDSSERDAWEIGKRVSAIVRASRGIPQVLIIYRRGP
jgi:hypothetical protein